MLPFLLGYPDSNQDKQDQNLLYYPYTIAQCYVFCIQIDTVISEMRCKGISFSETSKAISNIFLKTGAFFVSLHTNQHKKSW